MTPTNDKKLIVFMWIVGLVMTIFIGVGLKAAFTYGQVKSKVEEHSENILKLQKNSADVVYIDNLIQSNYLMIDVIKSNPLTDEKDKALKEWKDFQIRVMRQANPTRGGSSGSGGGAVK